MMNEALFQFIWKYSLYNPVGLKTTAGEPLTVIHPGTHNHHSGPDFSAAKIKIGTTTMFGNVELHLKTSDWKAHGHDADGAYGNIILHVVFQDDEPNDFRHPKLELANAIPAYVLDRYTNFLHTQQRIACAAQHQSVNAITKESWLNRLLAERWEQKLDGWKAQLAQASGDWRTLLYWRMAHNFGFKVNADAFLLLAQSLPLNILSKHKTNLLQVEALLFGQAGMLQKTFEDAYPLALQKEYFFLKKKYNLSSLPPHLWKFLRMRPANFPTIRIAQFAALIHQSVQLFSELTETFSVPEIYKLVRVTASNYWDTHFTFEEAQDKPSPKKTGKTSADNIIINTIAPLQFLYAHLQGNGDLQEKALQLLSGILPEKNNITETYVNIGWKPSNALQSQALIQLYHNYCEPKKCLNCSVGLSIIKSAPVK